LNNLRKENEEYETTLREQTLKVKNLEKQLKDKVIKNNSFQYKFLKIINILRKNFNNYLIYIYRKIDTCSLSKNTSKYFFFYFNFKIFFIHLIFHFHF